VSDSLDRRSPSEPLCGTSLFYFILFNQAVQWMLHRRVVYWACRLDDLALSTGGQQRIFNTDAV